QAQREPGATAGAVTRRDDLAPVQLHDLARCPLAAAKAHARPSNAFAGRCREWICKSTPPNTARKGYVLAALAASMLPAPGPSGVRRLDCGHRQHAPARGRQRMNPNYLDFEQPIADLEGKIQELRHASHGPAVNIDAEIHALQDKLRQRTAHIFRDLSPWQVSQLSRHPARP